MLRQLDSPAPPTVPSGHEDMQCPVFGVLMDVIDKHGGAAILDLGRAHSAQLELLAPYRCKLYFEDAHELIHGLAGGDEAEADLSRLRQWLAQWTAAEPETLDAVLAWDVVNYLEPPLFAAFIERLAPLLRPGALLYFLVYTRPDMPAQPLHYKAIATDRLAYRPSNGTVRPAPRLSQMEIKRRLPTFKVVKSVLLRSGVQEYLLKI